MMIFTAGKERSLGGISTLVGIPHKRCLDKTLSGHDSEIDHFVQKSTVECLPFGQMTLRTSELLPLTMH